MITFDSTIILESINLMPGFVTICITVIVNIAKSAF